MSLHEQDIQDVDELIANVSHHDDEFLYYLLGSATTGELVQPQSAGQASATGKQFFEKFKKQLKKVICSKDGPYEQFVKGMAKEKDLPKLVVIAILAGAPAISGIVVTNIIAVYVAMLLVRSGLAAYCEGYTDGKSRNA